MRNPERAQMLQQLRAELVGPALTTGNEPVAEFVNGEYRDERAEPWGRLVWKPDGVNAEELICWRSGKESETPWKQYATGVLWPDSHDRPPPDDRNASLSSGEDADENGDDGGNNIVSDTGLGRTGEEPEADDFEVGSADARRPSTMGISFRVRFDAADEGAVIVRLPRKERFFWQNEDSMSFPVNGCYVKCGTVIRKREQGGEGKGPVEIRTDAWGRRSVLPDDVEDVELSFEHAEFQSGSVMRKDVPVTDDVGLKLVVELYPRRVRGEDNVWLCTAVLRNRSQTGERPGDVHEKMLYQTFFEARAEQGKLIAYPEGQRKSSELDDDEKSMRLLYRNSEIWGIGHACAAAWDCEPGETPGRIRADVLPAVELPSMTPDIATSDDDKIPLRMRELAGLPDRGEGGAWEALDRLAKAYEDWIGNRADEIDSLRDSLQPVARVHLDRCRAVLERIRDGIRLLREDEASRRAFRLANLAMLLQQIAQKNLKHRPLIWEGARDGHAVAGGSYLSPWDVWENGEEGDLGSWRAFQLAFLLMSLRGMVDEKSDDRGIVDLIWFPTGGGKTEAYLGLMAFSMFHQRLDCGDDGERAQQASGTHVIMRYTLRMLTTQQFQRAASLICAMEFLRRHPDRHGEGNIPGERFSLGLWIGSSAVPNTIQDAAQKVRQYGNENTHTTENPLVLNECPWCRAEIGRYDGDPPQGVNRRGRVWARHQGRLAGLELFPDEGPVLSCSDPACEFHQEYPQDMLPVEVIDERMYRYPPSLLISTVDKFAMLAWKPEAGAFFGREKRNGTREPVRLPPRLFVQDELHLISGPLGTMYALYEGVFERLCSTNPDGSKSRPKIVAATATIRGAGGQVRALYDRGETCLFPPPGLDMGDSFFGRYARDGQGRLEQGRMYVGIHAANLPSMMTAQQRVFAAALHAAYRLPEETDARDPWWTLLAFYNSIRELGGALTLFHSDIPARLGNLFRREGAGSDERRYLNRVAELTSRLRQGELVEMMDRLSTEWTPGKRNRALDACLASNIIEVGVDIERLSLMAVVGQPKNTAQYIQVTGRVGRMWRKRPGLILSIYSTGKSRDRSHYEQFHGYHRRLYEQVEPTTATPFALSAILRGLPGALIAWARQHGDWQVQSFDEWKRFVDTGLELLRARCRDLEPAHADRIIADLDRVAKELKKKWASNPEEWGKYAADQETHYLMLWPGRYYKPLQKRRGVTVPSSMRSVDNTGRLQITGLYGQDEGCT